MLRPIVTLLVFLAVTVALCSGFTRLAPQTEAKVFLPHDSRAATASGKITALFGGSDDTITARLLFHGNAVLAPKGLSQIDGVLSRVASDASPGYMWVGQESYEFSLTKPENVGLPRLNCELFAERF